MNKKMGHRNGGFTDDRFSLSFSYFIFHIFCSEYIMLHQSILDKNLKDWDPEMYTLQSSEINLVVNCVWE